MKLFLDAYYNHTKYTLRAFSFFSSFGKKKKNETERQTGGERKKKKKKKTIILNKSNKTRLLESSKIKFSVKKNKSSQIR